MGETKRKIQPLCTKCSHPVSFHSGGMKCKALGCVKCESYDGPAPGEPAPTK